MPKRYKKLILCCIALSAIFVGLVALPRHWSIKSGMTQREYETAMAATSNEMVTAKSPSERQIVMRRIQKLIKMQSSGEIDKATDMTWLLNGIRFIFIAAILTLCWFISVTVYKYAAELNDTKESSAAKS